MNGYCYYIPNLHKSTFKKKPVFLLTKTHHDDIHIHRYIIFITIYIYVHRYMYIYTTHEQIFVHYFCWFPMYASSTLITFIVIMTLCIWHLCTSYSSSKVKSHHIISILWISNTLYIVHSVRRYNVAAKKISNHFAFTVRIPYSQQKDFFTFTWSQLLLLTYCPKLGFCVLLYSLSSLFLYLQQHCVVAVVMARQRQLHTMLRTM